VTSLLKRAITTARTAGAENFFPSGLSASDCSALQSSYRVGDVDVQRFSSPLAQDQGPRLVIANEWDLSLHVPAVVEMR
jgi:hypothetical protein